MSREYSELDIDTLNDLYQEETNKLNAELIAGASWESLREQKVKVTELAIILHKKKKESYLNPAEFISARQQEGTRLQD